MTGLPISTIQRQLAGKGLILKTQMRTVVAHAVATNIIRMKRKKATTGLAWTR